MVMPPPTVTGRRACAVIWSACFLAGLTVAISMSARTLHDKSDTFPMEQLDCFVRDDPVQNLCCPHYNDACCLNTNKWNITKGGAWNPVVAYVCRKKTACKAFTPTRERTCPPVRENLIAALIFLCVMGIPAGILMWAYATCWWH